MKPGISALWKTVAAYGLMLSLAALAFYFILRQGQALGGPLLNSGFQAAAAQPNTLLHLLLALAAVLACGRALGWLFKRLRQPPVIAEVIAGICLGPSLLGHFFPEAGAFLLPAAVAPLLGAIAQLGVILYMFQVGLELDLSELKGKGHSTIAISHASIVLPFLLGSLLALWLYPRFASQEVPFLSFALFMGVAMSITAFPVLTRILADEGLTKSALGTLALSCAAVDDATAWCLLAMVVGVAQAEGAAAALVPLWTLGFILGMIMIARPLIRRVLGRTAKPGQGTVALVFLGVLLAALTTEAIGIHAIFGAFMLGVLIPHDSKVAKDFEVKLKDVVGILLLPAFFAFTGMRTQIGLLEGGLAWGACALVIVVATLGKFGGAALAARFSGLKAREATALGILMNTRGLVELIVLNVGLDLKIITPQVFAMMVVMALATTLATAPALRIFVPGLSPRR
jgi:Kef-type K+ transport system membrane component KefB